MTYNQLKTTINMKTFRFWAGCLVAVLCMGMLTACDDDDEVSYGEIAGEWETTYSEGWEIYEGEREEWSESIRDEDRIIIRFDTDGSFTTWLKGYNTNEDDGRYELNGKYLTLYYTDDMDETYYIASLDGNTMVMEYSESDYFERTTFAKR